MISKIINLSRFKKQLIILLFDSVFLVSILLISFSLRLGYWYFPESDLVWVIFGAPIIAVPIFIRFGLYRSIVRYMGFKDIRAIVQAVSLYAILWGILSLMSKIPDLPRSVIIINAILSIVFISS